MSEKKILVVEDDKNVVRLLKEILENFEDVEFFAAYNGNLGLEQAKLIKPNLIILDNKMPDIPGEHVAKFLRTNVLTKDIPIIMLTALQLSEDEINLIKLEINEYLLKPINQWELQKTIEKYLGPLVKRL